jgi:hypothetical protein
MGTSRNTDINNSIKVNNTMVKQVYKFIDLESIVNLEGKMER